MITPDTTAAEIRRMDLAGADLTSLFRTLRDAACTTQLIDAVTFEASVYRRGGRDAADWCANAIGVFADLLGDLDSRDLLPRLFALSQRGTKRITAHRTPAVSGVVF